MFPSIFRVLPTKIDIMPFISIDFKMKLLLDLFFNVECFVVRTFLLSFNNSGFLL